MAPGARRHMSNRPKMIRRPPSLRRSLTRLGDVACPFTIAWLGEVPARCQTYAPCHWPSNDPSEEESDATARSMAIALTPNRAWARLASDEQVARTAAALETNGIRAIVVDTGDEAPHHVFGLLPAATGSQLATYAYGAGAVIWVVGSQKIVPDLDAAFRRIYEYSFPREDERAREAYGIGSGVNKMLVVNREVVPGRISMILVKQEVGF